MSRPWTAIVRNRGAGIHERRSYTGSFDMTDAVNNFINENKDLELIALIPGDIREMAIHSETTRKPRDTNQLFSGF